MPATLQPLKQLSEQEQAVYFHSRERRKSLAGLPELFRTHRIFGTTVMAVSNIVVGTFPVRDSEVTFQTAIRIADNTTARAGLIFEFGSSTSGLALWMDDTTLNFRAGGTGNAGVSGVYDNVVQWPATLELDLVAAVRPGLGLVAVWANGREIIKAQSIDTTFLNGEWAAASAGSFAEDVQGTTPADVGETLAPVEFTVIEPMSVYVGSRPRQFITPVTP